MINFLKKYFPNLTTKLRIVKFLVLKEDSFIYTSGWFNSIKTMTPSNLKNQPVPWMNYSFVEFLSSKIKKHHCIFEFGSGNSTIYFANLAESITSLEYDLYWFDKVKSLVPNNSDLIFKEKDIDGEYCRVAADSGKKYDIIIVDGRDRVNCLEKSIVALKDHGVLILDDSHEPKYLNAFNILSQYGFKHLTIEGFKPCSQYLASSTIFYKQNNCLDI